MSSTRIPCSRTAYVGRAAVSADDVIRSFGSFGVVYRPSRAGRNPKSGVKVDAPAKCVPHFKAGKELRIRVETTSVTGK
jgi:integration host factor subunit beta